MKWKEFRKLPAIDRRARHSKAGILKRALARWLKEAKKETRFAQYFKEPLDPFLSLMVPILSAFRDVDGPRDFKAWLEWHLPNPSREGYRISAPHALITTIKTDPHMMLGFWNTEREFIPGMLSCMADDAYTDVLEEFLSVEDLSGLTIDEVVAKCAKRGQRTSNDVVRQRVRCWDAKM